MSRARLVLGLLSFVILGLGLLLTIAPGLIEDQLQGVVPHDRYVVSADAEALHESLIVADWHADSLLWDRDLLRRSPRGHVDFPRLRAGNVAIQVFTAVTKTPSSQSYESNSADTDSLSAFVVLQAWPRATWSSLLSRALYQSERLHDFAARSPEMARVVRSRSELSDVLELRDRVGADAPVASLLGIEGAHALEGDLANVERLYDAGYRMIGLHHFFDNALGGSLHGESKGGLTDFGRDVVRALEHKQIIIDLAHSSVAVVDEVLEMATRPVVVSHTGLYGVCETARNLRDAQMKRIADAGGLIAVGYWKGAVCDISPAGVARAIRYAVDLLGERHVALGSDFDGSTRTTFDTSELAVLTEALLAEGLSADRVRLVMGGNSVRFLLKYLPPGSSTTPPLPARQVAARQTAVEAVVQTARIR